jgi:endonuclease/exonuclease/phosphatase family metal-dependent hydrolase
MTHSSGLRVLTWNLHGGVGLDGVRDYGRLMNCVASLDVDIAALQEVDGRLWDEAGTVADAFQHHLGLHGIFAAAIESTDGHYGQMLLSRWAFRSSEIHDISVPTCEPRRAIVATVQTASGGLRIIATHLGLKVRERRIQAERLHEILGRSQMPTILLGDFNDWSRFQATRGLLERMLPSYTRHRTFPSRSPLFALDRIYYQPAGLLRSSRVVKGARMLSDHLPLVADLNP